MGSLSRMKARQRFIEALGQRLDKSETKGAKLENYSIAIDKLLGIVTDDQELNRVARDLAVDLEEIEWP